MITASAELSALYASTGVWGAGIIVEVDPSFAGSWISLSDLYGFDWVVSADWGASADAPVMDARITLRRAHADAPYLNLSPFAVNSRPNLPNVLLKPFVPIRIRCATVPRGSIPAAVDYSVRGGFDGRIDAVSVSMDSIELQCRDESSILQDRFIETEKHYGTLTGGSAVQVQTVMQSILDNHYNDKLLRTAGSVPARQIDLYSANGTSGTPFNAGDSPGWAIKQYAQERQTIMEALRVLSDQIGYRLSWRYHEGSGINGFALTFENPDRSTTTAQITLRSEQILSYGSGSLALTNIRNACALVYRDTRGNRVINTASTAFANGEDASSINVYGRRWSEINQEAVQQMDTNTEADKMFDAFLKDCRDPVIQWSITIPYMEIIQVNDRISVPTDNIITDAAYVLPVVSYRHRFDASGAVTDISLAGTVGRSASKGWLRATANQTLAPVPGRNHFAGGAELRGIPNLLPNGSFSSWSKG